MNARDRQRIETVAAGHLWRGTRLLIFAATLGLAGCPSDDARPTPPTTVTPTISGQLATGLPLTNNSLIASSNNAAARAGRVDASGRYIVASSGLSAPYFFQSSAGYAATSSANGAGNATPLTELQILERIRAPLDPYFIALFNTSRPATEPSGVDLTLFNTSALVEAQARVVRLLRQQLGVIVPPQVANASFADTAFTPAVGDPMFDTLIALQTALEQRGKSLQQFESERVQEFRRCDAELLTITLADDLIEFCPASKQSLPDPDDDGIRDYRFTTIDAQTLTLRARDALVLSARLVVNGRAPYGCEAIACLPLSLSAAAENGSRTVTLNAVLLRADDGSSAALSGSLQTAVPGAPALNCTVGVNAPGVINFDDGSSAAGCYGFAALDRVSRVAYDSQLAATDAPQQIELRNDGDAIIGVVVYHPDPDSFIPVVDYKCRLGDCNNVAIGAPDSANLRVVTLNNTRVVRVGGDGSGPQSATLQGSFTLAEPPLANPPDCTAAAADQTITARIGGTSSDWNICPPYDIDNGNIGGFLVDEFNLLRYPGSFIGDFVYRFLNDFNSIGSVTIVASQQGIARRLEYQRGFADVFACRDSACLGAITIQAPNAQTAHRVQIRAVTLPEVELSDLPGDRSVTLQGSLLTVPDCFITGEGC